MMYVLNVFFVLGLILFVSNIYMLIGGSIIFLPWGIL